MRREIEACARGFQILGDFIEASPYGNGHINDTYVLAFDQGGRPLRYILQRVNHEIFRDPPSLMDNVRRVTSHIQQRLAAAGEREISRKALTLIPARDGKPYCRDDEGGFWRTYVFVERARTYEAIETTEHAFEAAKAFGDFQNMLTDLAGPRLTETIPNFHNPRTRFEAFTSAVEADVCNRAALARREIDFFFDQEPMTRVLADLQEKGAIPERITHNDTKLNNVLLDEDTGKGMCVIDLDTAMPGLALYDFGDMVRTATSPAEEDERDLSKVFMQMRMFEALVRGYLSTAGRFLNEAEVSHLAFSGKLITYVIGIRFLTDYLAGDTYFKVHREGHNLDRCRTQVKLIQSILEQEEEMNRVVGNEKDALGL
jgi:hypothetical protein